MNKKQKNTSVNNQEDEDCEVYTLYPENANECMQCEKPDKNLDPYSKTSTQIEESHSSINTNR